MEIQFTPEQEAFIHQAIASGRVQRAEEAVEQALSMWVERERSRLEILAALDEAEADMAAGRYTELSEETLPQFMNELKQEARQMRQSKISA